MVDKKNRKKDKRKTSKDFFSIDKYLDPKYQTIAAIALIILVFIIYFAPMYFGGKTFQSGDIIAVKSFVPYLEEEGEGYSLWNPYVFCGVPSFSTLVDFPWFNFIPGATLLIRKAFIAIFSVEYSQWSLYVILLAINMFFLIKYLTKNILISLFGALASSLSTGIIFYLFVGHVTKLISLSFFPLLLLMVIKYEQEKSLLRFILMTVVILFTLQGFHVQIIYYTFSAFALYFIFNFIYDIVEKKNDSIRQNLNLVGSFALAAIIALLIQSAHLTQLYEYSPYSTRGSKSILDLQSKAKLEKSDMDFYQYATNWSFSPGEMMTFIVPSYYGYGNVTYKGPLTQNAEVEVNTYFGQMPFVDVPMYMGVVIFLLALFL